MVNVRRSYLRFLREKIYRHALAYFQPPGSCKIRRNFIFRPRLEKASTLVKNSKACHWPNRVSLLETARGRDNLSLAMPPSFTGHGAQYDTKSSCFDSILRATFVGERISGFLHEPACTVPLLCLPYNNVHFQRRSLVKIPRKEKDNQAMQTKATYSVKTGHLWELYWQLEYEVHLRE